MVRLWNFGDLAARYLQNATMFVVSGRLARDITPSGVGLRVARSAIGVRSTFCLARQILTTQRGLLNQGSYPTVLGFLSNKFRWRPWIWDWLLVVLLSRLGLKGC